MKPMLMLVCATSTVINYSNVWNKDDIKNLNIAKSHCKEIYKEAPCLITFIKMSDLTYRAICGTEK